MDQDIKTIIQYPTGATEFDIPFDYLSRKFVRVSLVSDDNRRLLSNITEYRYVSKTRVKLLVPTDGFDRVELRRVTSATERVVDFVDGSVLRAADLNASQVQAMHIAEEGRDRALMSISVTDSGKLDAHGMQIINVAPGTDKTHAINKDQLDTTLGQAGGILSQVLESQRVIEKLIDDMLNGSIVNREEKRIHANGEAAEGTSVINLADKPVGVTRVEINGSGQHPTYHYDYDRTSGNITLATPLKKKDFVAIYVIKE